MESILTSNLKKTEHLLQNQSYILRRYRLFCSCHLGERISCPWISIFRPYSLLKIENNTPDYSSITLGVWNSLLSYYADSDRWRGEYHFIPSTAMQSLSQYACVLKPQVVSLASFISVTITYPKNAGSCQTRLAVSRLENISGVQGFRGTVGWGLLLCTRIILHMWLTYYQHIRHRRFMKLEEHSK